MTLAQIESIIISMNRYLMMLGGPGSGKSTYSEATSKHFGIPHIYPGDVLRKSADPEVKALLSKGEFAPLDVVVKIIKQEISKSPNGYILDGFPRNMEQLKEMQKANIEVNRVIYLDESEAETLRRLTARARFDDTLEIIKNRFKVYARETGPVVDYYKDKNEFISIKAGGDTAENTSKKIIKELENDIEWKGGIRGRDRCSGDQDGKRHSSKVAESRPH